MSGNTIIERYFDKILSLPTGSKLFVPCTDRRDQESKRVLMYNQKKKYRKINPDIDIEIRVRKENQGEDLFIVIEKLDITDLGFVVTPDGEVEKIDISMPDRKKIKYLVANMIKDGHDQKEIEAILDNYDKEDIKEAFRELLQPE